VFYISIGLRCWNFVWEIKLWILGSLWQRGLTTGRYGGHLTRLSFLISKEFRIKE